MARLPRVVVADVAHHVTQRGNARQVILESDSDRTTYLALLRQYSDLHRLSLLGYCLMSNHVHLIAVPQSAESLALALKHAHGRYAAYWNARRFSTGHVWQGRFYSCPMEESHLWEALRYVELNPVRAGMVGSAAQWKWSSAAAHCGASVRDAILAMERWRKQWSAAEWRQYLEQAETPDQLSALRRATYTGRPWGKSEFVAELEKMTSRPLAPQKGGRPKKAASDLRQLELSA